MSEQREAGQCAALPKPAVRKTLVRNTERRVNSDGPPPADTLLGRPGLCSSAALVARRNAIHRADPPPARLDPSDLLPHRQLISEKVTKKLNFPFNDTIYKNLIELNANHVEMTSQDKRIFPATSHTSKREQEPKLEDFFPEEIDSDEPPDIPAVRPPSKPVRTFNDNRLHKLVSSFENL